MPCTSAIAILQNTIWVLWKNNINRQVIAAEEQHVTISIFSADGSLLLLKCIYASCDGRKIRELWSSLTTLNPSSPWLVSWDFNVVRTQDEKMGETL